MSEHNLTDAEIISKVAELDAEVQALAEASSTAVGQFFYSIAATYTSEAAAIATQEKRFSDISTAYRYGYNLRAAAKNGDEIAQRVGVVALRRGDRSLRGEGALGGEKISCCWLQVIYLHID